MKCKVFIVSVILVCTLLAGSSLAHKKVVVIPLVEDKHTCTGTLVGTRWCDNGNQTVTDMTTGLVWLKHADWGETRPWRSPVGYSDAHMRAGILDEGEVVHIGIGNYKFILNDGSDLGDWRLPTKTELYNLANGTEAVRSSNMRAFRGVKSWTYWSSSTFWSGVISDAWVVYMSSGTALYDEKIYSHYVWPVRGGN